MFSEIILANELRLDWSFVRTRFRGHSAILAASKRLSAFLARPILGSGKRALSTGRCTEAGKVLFFSSTLNQTRALSNLLKRFDGASLLLQNHLVDGAISFPVRRAWLTSMLWLPYSIGFCAHFVLRGEGGTWTSRALCLAYSLDEVLMTPGYLHVSHSLLAAWRPSTVVMSNDHNTLNRVICIEAQKLGIPTVYVQHAPVSPLFPSVLFDRLLLDGQEAADVYSGKCGPSTEAMVVGASRYDGLRRSWRGAAARSRGRISIAFNKIDDLAIVKKYAEVLNAGGWNFVLRPHPGIADDVLRWRLAGLPVDRRETFLHLAEVDAVVAGNSGILLDAFMCGACPIHAEDFSDVRDYYGYKRRDAVICCNLDTVIAALDGLDSGTEARIARGMWYFNGAIGADESVVDVQVRKILELAD